MELHNLPDCKLIEQFINGHQKSIEVLVNRYKDKVYSYIYYNVGNRTLAEDIFQETFIKVIKSLREGKYSDEGKMLGWINRIAHNLIIDYFRNRQRIKQTSSDDDESVKVLNTKRYASLPVETEIINNQSVFTLKKLINYLPKEQQEIVQMRMYQDYSFKDIAEEKGISINTALGRMRYAVLNLKKIIDKKGIQLSIE